MRKIFMSFAILSLGGLISINVATAADCNTLINKYDAPDPSKKTMAQLKRWAQRKLENNPDLSQLESCLIAQAADNPNRDRVAGK